MEKIRTAADRHWRHRDGLFTLTTIHQAMITAWRARHGCASASEAIRQMIEIAEQTDAAATHGRESSTSPS